MAITRPQRLYVAVHIGLALVLLWLGVHMIRGPNGVLAWMTRMDSIEEQTQTLAQMRQHNEALRLQIARLQSPIDLDFLEERVRLVLGFVARGEEVVLLKQHGK